MSLQELLNFRVVDANGNPNFSNAVDHALRQIYHGSETIRAKFNQRIETGVPIKFEYIPQKIENYNFFDDSHLIASSVRFDFDAADEKVFVSQLGETFGHNSLRLFVHEIIHALYQSDDANILDLNNSGFDFQGPTVDLENSILSEMGSSVNRTGYFANFNTTEVYRDTYTFGGMIDLSIRGDYSFVDTTLSQALPTKDLMIGGVGSNTFVSGLGDDFLWGYEGDDVLDAGGGNDLLIGGYGADQLFGGAGNDRILFDADDFELQGGSGRDIAAVASGSAGVTLNLTASEIEVAIGGTGNDTITTGDSTETLMVAGGNGDDTFTISVSSGQGPRIVWGGGGADVINLTAGAVPMQAGILAVSVANLTEESFQTLTPAMLGQLGVDLSKIAVIVLNPDSADSISIDGQIIDVGSFGYDVMIHDVVVDSQTAIGWHVGEDIAPILQKDSTYLGPNLEIQGSWNDGMSEAGVVGLFSFQEYYFTREPSSDGGGGAGTYLTPSEVANKLQMLYPEIAGFDWVFVGDLDDEYSDEIFFYELLDETPSPNAEDAGHASWFVAGGEFSGTTLSANGSLTMTMPGNNASALDWLLAA